MTPAGASAGVASASDSSSGSASVQGGQQAVDGGHGGNNSLPGTSGAAPLGDGAAASNGGSGVSGSGASGAEASSNGGGVGATAGHGGVPAIGACGDLDKNGVDDCSETLIQNSRFDMDDSYWAAEALALSSWDAQNANAGTGSGSLLIANQAPVDPAAGSFMTGAHQCLQINGNAGYVVAVRVMIPGGQGTGAAGVNLQIFGADNCAGTFLTAETVDTSEEVDTWSVVKGEVQMPSAARSVWVRLVVSKPFAQATLRALFDDILVRPN
jgi:hypothetical protein